MYIEVAIIVYVMNYHYQCTEMALHFIYKYYLFIYRVNKYINS